ncbi:hypothetical protein KCP76_13900 [Salmonella enterica subsp. enterica serovar Weltevreden]|nr:hypothetical protein KCP76_13900 [Salmonella enterica subsp. enterica serovar Weltevreden]
MSDGEEQIAAFVENLRKSFNYQGLLTVPCRCLSVLVPGTCGGGLVKKVNAFVLGRQGGGGACVWARISVLGVADALRRLRGGWVY